MLDQTKRNKCDEITNAARSSLDLYLDNYRFVQDNWDEFQEKYGGMRIAVSNKRIIAVSDNTADFIHSLSGLTDTEKACTYITKINYLNELVVV